MKPLTIRADFPVFVYWTGETRGLLPDGRPWSFWSLENTGRPTPIAHEPVGNLILLGGPDA